MPDLLPKMGQISCAITTKQVEDEEKDVTRRWGWRNAKPGDFLRVVDKLRFRASAPPQRTIACVEVVRVDRVLRHDFHRMRPDCREEATAWDFAAMSIRYWEQRNLWDHEIAREGFPGMSADEFIGLLVKMAPAVPEVLTRIEWKYRRDIHSLWIKTHPPHTQPSKSSPLQAFFSFDADGEDSDAHGRGTGK